MINYKENFPYVEGVSLEFIDKVQQTPYYLYSQAKISEAYNKLKDAVNSKIYFAVKSNSNQAILKLMNNLGAGADVVSIGELKRSLEAGITSSKIVYEGVGKSKEDLIFAINANIKQINIESLEEIKRIDQLSRSLEKKINVGVRLNPNIDSKSIDKISTGKNTDKFGISIEDINTIENFLNSSNNLNLTSISCHIGSQINEIKVFENVFKIMKEAAKQFIEKGFKVESLVNTVGHQYTVVCSKKS